MGERPLSVSFSELPEGAMTPRLRCIFHASAADCLREARSDLLLRESEHSLMLGLLSGIIDGVFAPSAPIYVSVTDGARYWGHALRTDSTTPLDLSAMEMVAVDCLAAELRQRVETLAKVVGPRDACHHFADRWTEGTGQRVTDCMEQGIYELREVQMPPLDGGQLRVGDDSDRATLLTFLEGFFRDTGVPQDVAVKRASHTLNRYLPKRALFLWEDQSNRVVSMAAHVRETDHGASISYVYTPEAHRRQGFGGRVVACLSKRLLEGGKLMCNLFTDLDNPTSNSVYQKLGYRLVARSSCITFDGSP